MQTSTDDKTPWWITTFALLLVLFPLAFGGNRPWASDFFALSMGGLLLTALLSFHNAPLPYYEKAPKTLFLTSGILLALPIAWSLIQTLTWTPSSWHHSMWAETQSVTQNSSGTISVDPAAFPESLARLLSYVACFFVAFFASAHAKGGKTILNALVGAAVFYAAYGLIIHITGSNSILWYKKWAYEGFLSSTFVNKNSYATYAGLGLVASMAFIWRHLKNLPIRKRSDIPSQIDEITNVLTLKDCLILAMPLLILCALVLTGSRAGIFASLFGCFVFIICIAINRRWSLTQWVGMFAIFMVVFLGFVIAGGDSLIDRSLDDQLASDASTRITAYVLEQRAIMDNPILGFGLGTFDTAFRLYRDETLPMWFQHAHNDYLEMMMDLGIPAALCLFTAIGLMVVRCGKGMWNRKRREYFPVLALAATGLVGAHSLVDFSLHMPAIAATYATLLGLGVAESWSSKRVN